MNQSKELERLGLNPRTADLSFINDGTAAKLDILSYSNALCRYTENVVEIIPSWSFMEIFKQLPSEVESGGNKYKLGVNQEFIYYQSPSKYLCYYSVSGGKYMEAIVNMVEYLVTNNLHQFK